MMTDTLTLPRFDAGNAHGEHTFAAQAAGILAYIEAVAGTEAQFDGLKRRLRKSGEELGEVSEAWLNLTGNNGKKKVAKDLLEEGVDVFIVAADTFLEYLRWMASKPELAAAYKAHVPMLKGFAVDCIATLRTPGAPESHDDRYWDAHEALLHAHHAYRQFDASVADVVSCRSLATAFLNSLNAATLLMYTYVEGLPQNRKEFDQLLIAMLEQKLTKWVTALARGSNAVQQA